jgi:hypothetical protein
MALYLSVNKVYIYPLEYSMRFLAFILSILVLTLTAIPCNDVLPDNGSHNSIISQQPTGNNTDDTHSGSVHCTPFCICQCCQASYYATLSIEVLPINPVKAEFPPYLLSFISAELSGCTKPPISLSYFLG